MTSKTITISALLLLLNSNSFTYDTGLINLNIGGS